MNEVSLDELSAERFAELVRTRFNVLSETDGTVSLELTGVTASRPGKPESGSRGDPTAECFSLCFDGPAEQPLVQRTYRFAHERLGWFELFIVPVGADRNSRQYEAVFNRRLCS